MKKTILALGLLIATSASASMISKLDETELHNLNWLIECPVELNEILTKDGGQWIGSGNFASDRPGSQKAYAFFKQTGFTSSEKVATLIVRRMNIRNPPADGKSFRVECEIQR